MEPQANHFLKNIKLLAHSSLSLSVCVCVILLSKAKRVFGVRVWFVCRKNVWAKQGYICYFYMQFLVEQEENKVMRVLGFTTHTRAS